MNPQQYENSRRENIETLKKRQIKDLEIHNNNRNIVKRAKRNDI